MAKKSEWSIISGPAGPVVLFSKLFALISIDQQLFNKSIKKENWKIQSAQSKTEKWPLQRLKYLLQRLK